MSGPAKREPVLTEHERQHPLWLKIKKHAEDRLALARERNDKSHPIDKTERLRGAIAELKHLAALDQPAPQTEADDFPD